MKIIMSAATAALGLLCASGVCAEDKVACGADMVCASAPASVGAAMLRSGYQGLVSKDDLGDPKIESAAAGYKFSVFFYGCTDHLKCDSLQFYASFDGDPSRDAAFANTWNADKRFMQMSVKPDHTIVVRYDVSTIGGLNQNNFADVVDWWSTMLGGVDRYFAAHPVPATAKKAG